MIMSGWLVATIECRMAGVVHIAVSREGRSLWQRRFFDRELPFDFYASTSGGSVLIEYQGIQHYLPVSFGGKKASPDRMLEAVRHRDQIKATYCRNAGIPLLVIPYWDYDKIDSILEEYFR